MSDPTTLAPAPPAPAPKEPTIKERASGLLAAMTDAQKHNAPITPWMLTELGAVVGQVTGNKAVSVPHLIMDARGLPDYAMIVKPDGSMKAVYSAEEVLAYVRSLPKDVQARPHWVAADNALVEAVASVPGADVSPAIRLFEAALAEDRKLDVKPVEIKDKPVAPEKTSVPPVVTPTAPVPAGLIMPDYPQYVRDLVKAWAAGDDHAGHLLRFLTSMPKEREAMYREAIASDERPDR